MPTANTVVVRDNVTPTLYGILLQSSLYINVPLTYMKFTTLNEKFNVQADVFPSVNSAPSVSYFGIGNGAHTSEPGPNGLSKNKQRQHKPFEAALLNHLPFVLREPNNDLTPAQRAKYAMRREETHNGLRYIAYYLKRIEKLNVTATAWYTTVVNGEANTTKYEPDSSVLNPVPDDIGPPVEALADLVSASTIIDLSLDSDDVLELLNVSNVLYADEGFAVLSEICLVSGVDRDIQVTSGVGGTVNFREVIGAQVTAFINTNQDLTAANQGVDLSVDIGRSVAVWKTVK
jgi:hypothetical protein